jgi:hypothetical protein
MVRFNNSTQRFVVAAFVVVVAVAPTAGTIGGSPKAKLDPKSSDPVTFALLGDLPYGAQQTLDLPVLIDDINAADDIGFVVHVGDIKRATTSCSDGALAGLSHQFGLFDDPLIFTPGDNDWTDCHLPSAGSYVPTERLEVLRNLFFPAVGRTLGSATFKVDSQAKGKIAGNREFVENVKFRHHNVEFATIHVVGANNDLNPWSGLPGGDRPLERTAEFEARNQAALDWLIETFKEAVKKRTAGVFLSIHADAVDAGGPGFEPFLALLTELAADYGKPVVLAHGDSHRLTIDRPFPDAPNITRVETFGENIQDWIAVTVDPTSPDVFSFDFRSTIAT